MFGEFRGRQKCYKANIQSRVSNTFTVTLAFKDLPAEENYYECIFVK